MNCTFCIAEAGSCHDGEYEKAVRLLHVAHAAGADAVKFQFWSSAKRLAERRRAPTYEAIYAKYQVPEVWLSWLKLACDRIGIEFMSTVYLPEDVPILNPWVKRWKIASFECGDDELFNACLYTGKPIIASTGMMDHFPRVGAQYLHCVSSYPAPLDQLNLAVCRDELCAGFSDHSRSTLTGGVAVAAGASMLEVHLRLDDTDPMNPDYATALTPAQLRDYVDFVRLTERMLGTGEKVPQPAEAEMAKYRVRQ